MKKNKNENKSFLKFLAAFGPTCRLIVSHFT